MRMTLGLGLSRRAAAAGGSNVAPVITGVPTISGTATVGNVLTASPASVSGTPSPTRTWQWRRNGVDIGGATASTYTLVAADYGVTITVRQTETNVVNSANATSAGTAIAWEPAALFQASEPGFWAPVNTSRLWQDTARTTPVTTAGQSVASWQLTTASGVVYAEQSNAASRPTYQVDTDGAPYLQFNGTTQWVLVPAINAGTDKSQAFAAYQSNSTSNRMLFETSTNVDLVNGATFFLVQGSGTNTIKYFSKGTILADPTTVTPVAANLKRYATGLGDISGDLAILREMGAETNRRTNDQGTGNFGNHPTYIGARNGTTLYYNGRIYGIILRYGPNLSADQVSSAESWMAALLNP